MSNLTLIIGNKNYSSWSLRPWIFLRQFNIPFTEKRIALFTKTMKTELAGYFSDNKVPVLQHGNLTVWDSLAIMEYVSESFLDGRGWPMDRKARAIARAVCAEMHSSFAHLIEAMPMNCRRKFINYSVSSDAQSDVNRVKALWKKCRHDYGQQGQWLFGNFSIADAMFAPIVLRFTGYGVALNRLEQDYVDTVLAHPDLQNWINEGKAEAEIIEFDEVDLPPGAEMVRV